MCKQQNRESQWKWRHFSKYFPRRNKINLHKLTLMQWTLMQFSGRKFKIITIKMLTVVREQYKNLVNLSTERKIEDTKQLLCNWRFNNWTKITTRAVQQQTRLSKRKDHWVWKKVIENYSVEEAKQKNKRRIVKKA